MCTAGVPDLIRAINAYVRINSQQPTSFIWTASVESIMVKIQSL